MILYYNRMVLSCQRNKIRVIFSKDVLFDRPLLPIKAIEEQIRKSEIYF